MLTKTSLLALAALQGVWAAPASMNQGCFPYGGRTLPKDGSVPSVSLNNWWCPQSMAYGFQGFSYPMENPDCDAYENSLAQMDADFAQMKRDFGASIVRMYYPVCTKAFIFERALQAAINNNMGLVFQVWTNFGVGTVWEESQQAMYDTLNNPKWKNIAPYVVHWADFGSEPVGDGMDGGREQFVQALGQFRDVMHSHHILAGISEDWDRPGIMRTVANGTSGLGAGLGLIGEGVKQNSDYAHIHPMPYYHFNDPEADAWGYIQNETLWVKQHTGLPVTITETQWSWATNFHNPGKSDVGLAQYTQYWKTFDAECEWFKENNVGWYFHSWRGEASFDILYANGDYVIPNNWRPKKC